MNERERERNRKRREEGEKRRGIRFSSFCAAHARTQEREGGWGRAEEEEKWGRRGEESNPEGQRRRKGVRKRGKEERRERREIRKEWNHGKEEE